MPYLKTQQVNSLGILSEWGPDPLRPLPNFCLIFENIIKLITLDLIIGANDQ